MGNSFGAKVASGEAVSAGNASVAVSKGTGDSVEVVVGISVVPVASGDGMTVGPCVLVAVTDTSMVGVEVKVAGV
jgi:hypothetical protein